MKIHEDKYVTRGSEAIRESYFEIGDGSHIIKLLRDSLYSNPILAICREISSNCRDAHREVGCTDPVEITLPNSLDDNIHFRDFGPGISPSRMDDVFVKFGNSTKRDSNVETGGFGLGAKTPFAYASTFIVETVSKVTKQSEVDLLNSANGTNLTLDEVLGNNIKCNYVASLGGDGNNGGVKLYSIETTNERTGTVITIGVKPEDRRKFHECIHDSTQYWVQKPIVKGASFSYKNLNDEIVKGNKWIIRYKNSSYYYSASSNYAIVDGIKYPLDLKHVESDFANALARVNLELYFDVGEVSLTPNREELQYNKSTVDAIKKMVEAIKESINDKVKALIDEKTSYREACLALKDFNNNVINFEADVFWNGNRVARAHVVDKKCNAKLFHIEKRYASRRHNGYRGERRIFKSIGSTWDTNEPIVIVDTKTAGSGHIEKAHNNFAGDFYLIQPSESVEELVKYFNDNYSVDLLQVGRLLSEFKPEESEKSSGNSSEEKRTYNRGKSPAWVFKSSNWEMVEGGVDRNGSGYYVSLSDRKQTLKLGKGGSIVNNSLIDKIINIFDIKDSVYGMKDEVIEKLGPNWVSLQEFVNEEAEKLKKISTSTLNEMFVAHHFANERECNVICNLRHADPSNSDFVEYKTIRDSMCELSATYKETSEKFRLCGLSLPDFPEPAHKIRALMKDLEEKYSMLSTLSSWEVRSNIENVKKYIRQMDELENFEANFEVRKVV